MAFVAVNGGSLYYEVHGTGDPLVLAHGLGGNHAIWWQQIAHFSRRHKVIVFDHRGFGLSESEKRPEEQEFATDLEGLMDYLGIDAAFFVGQSMGGRTCVNFATQHPQRVYGLVLSASTGGLPVDWVAPPDLRLWKANQVDRVLSPFFQQREPALTELYLQISSFNRVTRARSSDVDVADVAPIRSPVVPDPLRLTMPALFIAGSDDVVTPPEQVRRAAEVLGHARYRELADCGHSPFFESPEAFNGVVDEFIDACRE